MTIPTSDALYLTMGAGGHLRNWRGWLPLSLKT
jgi:hypothetical protein